MKLSCQLVVLAIVALMLVVASCGVGGSTLASTGTTGSLTISPQPLSIGEGDTVTFTCTSSITASAACNWDLEGAGLTSLGSPSAASGTNTLQYTAPASPPIYASPIGAFSQGVVNLNAYYGFATMTIPITITAPSVTVGILSPVSSVVLGGTGTFTGYAVGNRNNGLTWQVNGVTGGSTATGTIMTPYTSSIATYYAPGSIPMGGSAITITAVSQADPTKTASTVITLH